MSHFLKLAGLMLVAVVGAFLFRALYVAASQPRPAAPPQQVRVRVAAADLPAGLLLRDVDLGWKTMARGDVPAGALIEGDARGDGRTAGAAVDASAAAAGDLKGDLLRHPVREGMPLGPADVILPSAPGFLAAALKPGMRAISVAIDDVSGNAGLIEPGDYVDVLLTQQLAAPGGAPADPERAVESETIAARVRVLAVGSAFQRPKDDAAQPNTRARTVTFEVSSHDAQVITVGAHLGALSLALRSFATSDRGAVGLASAEPPAPPVWAGDVSRALRAEAPAATSAQPRRVGARAGGERHVIVYRGSKQDDGAGAGAPLPGGVPPIPTLPPLPGTAAAPAGARPAA
ncbi:Flp pilus assembly protein CpaB [Burkholderia thailandensis E254]|uniref:Flp pilus assembly protein CpaB family n=7 Tax=Burkholderia thailandensis TaxID=57975 RepID=Q2SVR8_BURTA|nr:Flp pilus assembly protein CpaB [Burkholderia thailandensis]ABC39332.1 Flp pilus assembly protein CpaB family [Burkholderia thailandensis E264]AIS96087.1 Flp pilus assembly protein CpaB [Burkholderia thailandensis MSMB59]AIT20473.1 Flp pilus assembly protein CpaB [Burkholderia thailandensis E254]AJX98187.1 Flp pilus assembly protein CpaB [Burkholderia thailandensis 2002721643]AOJ45182.1 pilus assembly protein CpaB [Burkholderia thailandensis]